MERARTSKFTKPAWQGWCIRRGSSAKETQKVLGEHETVRAEINTTIITTLLIYDKSNCEVRLSIILSDAEAVEASGMDQSKFGRLKSPVISM